jgi:hypothetical protein
VAPVQELIMQSIARSIACAMATAAGSTVFAADACWPVRTLSPSTPVRFEAQEFELLPRLQAVAGEPLILTADPAAFGLSGATPATPSRLLGAVPVQAQILSHSVRGFGSGQLHFERTSGRRGESADKPSGRIFLQAGQRRYIVRVEDGIARGADLRPLELQPLLATETPFSVAAGSSVSVAGPQRVQLAAGSRLEWSADQSPGGLEATLVRGARLEQSAPPHPGVQLQFVQTARVLAGARLRLKVTAPGFDFGRNLLAFCFSGPGGRVAGTTAALPATGYRLLERSGDSATFDVPVPEELIRVLGEPKGWDAGLLGREAKVRVLGYDGAEVALDTEERFTVSSTFAAVAAGLLLLGGAFLVGALFMGSLNPLRTLRELARGRDGTYSLSNVQVLLWTLLVIFALCFVWVGSGQLLAISQGILVLLGISGGSSVLARAIGKSEATTAAARAPVMADLFRNKEGHFDLLRFQMLGFTLFTWFYSLVSVLRSEGLPEIPSDLYLLMGISNAAYIGGKIAPKLGQAAEGEPEAAPADLSEAERALMREDIEKLQRTMGVAVTGRLDEATRTAITNYKRQHGITPANGRVNPLFLRQMATG